MEDSLSSKVTVEYHDPSGLFPLLAPELRARLPLRDLLWKTAQRPLRSIDSLYVEFVPAPAQSSSCSEERTSKRGSQGHDNSEPARQDGDSAVTDSSTPPTQGRRHQIPGLHQTPYLKVFLLRCDDKETYKTTSKQLLRDWLKKNAPSTPNTGSVNSKENHDAFEWLLLHVVLPDTEAAAQPRWTAASRESSNGPVEKHSSGTRWPGQGRTILEKIRKNFNVHGKLEPDRVAQIRLRKNAVPQELLPAGSATVSATSSESPQEQENAWRDLISKFKTLILMSFDRRVRQYEEDIQQKNSQRSLPGWNFCTFFVLKEGLAKAFESVGLVEDALAGYDELAAQFNSFIRGQVIANKDLQGGLLSNRTVDIREQLRVFKAAAEAEKVSRASNGTAPGGTDHHDGGDPLGERKKKYTDLILSNTVSVFDLECYVFSRQMALLLRLGNARHPRLASNGTDSRPRSSSLPNIKEGGQDMVHAENLSYLAELCQRALYFVTAVARIMREDLLKGVPSPPSSDVCELIDRMVYSWTFDVVRQVLDATYVSSVDKPPKPDSQSSPASAVSRRVESSPITRLDPLGSRPNIRLTQTSSLANPKYSTAESLDSNALAPSQVIYENERFSNSEPDQRQPIASSKPTGCLELAAYRAELLLVQRNIIRKVGNASGWLIAWDAPQIARFIGAGLIKGLEGESNGGDSAIEGESRQCQPSIIAYRSPVLRSVAGSIEGYRSAYENFSDRTLQHYLAAERTKSAESIMKDMAVLQFERGHYANAAAYFGRTASFYANDRWNSVEATLLKMHAWCLKELGRKDEYVSVVLTLLSKKAAMEQSRIAMQTRKTASPRDPTTSNTIKDAIWLDDDNIVTDGYLSELIRYSTRLPHQVSVSMSNYFSDIQVDPYIQHFPDKDGFRLQLRFRHLLQDNVTIDCVRTRLTSTEGQNLGFWLQTDTPLQLRPGMTNAWLTSNTSALGFYTVDKIFLEAGRLNFVHDIFSSTEETVMQGSVLSTPKPPFSASRRWHVLCYPRAGALNATLNQSKCLRLDRTRTLDVDISSFMNDVDNGEVHLRSATAGLRLRTGDVEAVHGDFTISDKSQPGLIKFSSLTSQRTMRMQIPYELERNVSEPLIRLEVRYHTDNGDFVYLSYETIRAGLQVDVTVHDTFTQEHLFSEFAVRSASSAPIEVLGVRLQGSEVFHVQRTTEKKESVLVLPDQEATFGYKIYKKQKRPSSGSVNSTPTEDSLPLTVAFRCVDDDILDAMEIALEADLSHSTNNQLGRLLKPYMLKGLRERILPADYDRIESSRKVDISSYNRFGLESIVAGLPSGTRTTFLEWLDAWRKTHATITIPPAAIDEEQASSAVHRVVIPFQISHVQFVHTVTLQFLEQGPNVPASVPVAVGQVLMAELHIMHTRQWSGLASTNDESHSDVSYDFVFEMEADPDYWLIAGQRKAHFSAREDELLTFPVILVPLKPGSLLLPRVDVRPWAADGQADLESETMSCETDYRNGTENILVIRNFRSTTLDLDFAAPEGTQARLVDVGYRGGKDAG